ncbi:AAA family ATPase [Allobranchiibius huperziae]|uniref:Chromosome partitioning protein n=1 Tax=Allobranchiibius huperziae TaxID=1874116 RepID=A0A853DQW5_9MICO|nr:chromosome partitioning protein [Allobranchiibius huperziae]
MSTPTIAVCNQKGGVGKTTTCYHLARAAAREGRRVLAIDLDPQGSLTAILAKNGSVQADELTIADVLSPRVQDVALVDVLTPGLWEGIQVAPATNRTLAAVRDELITTPLGRERRLADAVAGVPGYDLVLVDCAPDLNTLMHNALVAAQSAVVVTAPAFLASEGLSTLLGTIEEIRGYYNPQLKVGGVVVNGYDSRRVGHRDRLAELEASGLPVLDPVIPQRAAIQDATDSGYGLDQWPGGYPLADLYQQLFRAITKEI